MGRDDLLEGRPSKQLRYPLDADRNDRQTTGHGLRQRIWHAFPAGRQHEQLARSAPPNSRSVMTNAIRAGPTLPISSSRIMSPPLRTKCPVGRICAGILGSLTLRD